RSECLTSWAKALETCLKLRVGSKKIIGIDGNPLGKELALKRLHTLCLQVTDFIGDENTSLPGAYHLVTI
ncbi:MAG: hypothetical protein WA261_15235, partial [Candidatus Sulfotelmatobacter sp.]